MTRKSTEHEDNESKRVKTMSDKGDKSYEVDVQDSTEYDRATDKYIHTFYIGLEDNEGDRVESPKVSFSFTRGNETFIFEV